jgi:hypothetical protein
MLARLLPLTAQEPVGSITLLLPVVLEGRKADKDTCREDLMSDSRVEF